MAYDLHTIVPPIHPVSVEYFLRDTVREVFQKPNRERESQLSVRKLLTTIFPAQLLRRKEHQESGVGRTTIVELLQSNPHRADLDIRSRLGVQPDATFKTGELAVWIFRELQALASSGHQIG